MKLPQGFTASGVAAGLKPSGSADLGLLVSDRPAAAAGVLTTNRVQAAPVLVTRKRLRRGRARAIVVNAGSANACTGARGIPDAEETARATADVLGVREHDVLVCSTGVIGVPLDVQAIRAALPAAARALGTQAAEAFARAIMTTDTRPKTAVVTAGEVTVAGFAKGAGMIAPEMATMLAFVLTDAPAPASVLRGALRRATAGTFNAISVDGCMSTNDTLLALANGAAGGAPAEDGSARARDLTEAIEEVCSSLAQQIVEDGEGATKVVAIVTEGAATEREARRAAARVADSVLLRCAMNGADPNWGRVMAALGTSGIGFDPDRVDVRVGGQLLCERGGPGPGDREKAQRALQERAVEIRIDLHRGSASATVLTNDLSADYVRINAEYTT